MDKSTVFPFSRRTLIWALIVVSALGAACSSDGDDASDAKADPSTTSTSFAFSGEGSEALCTRLQDFNTTYTTEALDPATVPVADVAARWAAAIAALKAMEPEANAEIAPDVTLLRERVEALQPALAAAGYDASKIPESERQRLQDEASQRASERLVAYGTQVCQPQSGK